MNRILFEAGEIVNGVAEFSGARAEHVLTVLHGAVGQTLKTGVLDGAVGTSVIERIDGGTVTVRVNHTGRAAEPWVDLVLAPPRPRSLKRLLPQLAALGVGRVLLVGAEKVEKAFWGAQLLREEIYRPLLVDGLQQAGTTAVPVIRVERNFRRWVETGLDAELAGQTARFVAHPYAAGAARPQAAHQDGVAAARGTDAAAGARAVLAVGPEGGWTEEEVERLEAKGFARLSLGARILRTDTALIALLARLAERYDPSGNL